MENLNTSYARENLKQVNVGKIKLQDEHRGEMYEKIISSPALMNLDSMTTSNMEICSNDNHAPISKTMMDCTIDHQPMHMSGHLSASNVQLDSGFETPASMTGWSTNTPVNHYDFVHQQNQTRVQSPQPPHTPQHHRSITNLNPSIANLSQATPHRLTPSFVKSNEFTTASTPGSYTPLLSLHHSQSFANTVAPSPPQIDQQQQTPNVYNIENNIAPNTAPSTIEPSPPSHVNGQTLVEELEEIMSNTDYVDVLTNSVILLFSKTIDSARGYDVCQAMSSSSLIMNLLYFILNTDQFKFQETDNANERENKRTILRYATWNLIRISEFEEFRGVLLSHNGPNLDDNATINNEEPSPGVKSLLQLLKIEDTDIIVFAITAIHNLLLDRRPNIQEMAKRQIKHGLRDIVMLLDNQYLAHNDEVEFKRIVLNSLQILAFGNEQNRLLIKACDGPRLILQTIQNNLVENRTEELIETGCKVLKALSACPENKIDIIRYNGIQILTRCIGTGNQEVMKTCLWTLRNLSDLMSKKKAEYSLDIMHLIDNLLRIMKDYPEEQSLITCTLGILFNLTCNNERIKQQICHQKGVELLIRTIEFWIVEDDIVEPAILALCNLVNQTDCPAYAENARMNIICNYKILQPIMEPNVRVSEDLCRAVRKLDSLTFQRLS